MNTKELRPVKVFRHNEEDHRDRWGKTEIGTGVFLFWIKENGNETGHAAIEMDDGQTKSVFAGMFQFLDKEKS